MIIPIETRLSHLGVKRIMNEDVMKGRCSEQFLEDKAQKTFGRKEGLYGK